MYWIPFARAMFLPFIVEFCNRQVFMYLDLCNLEKINLCHRVKPIMTESQGPKLPSVQTVFCLNRYGVAYAFYSSRRDHVFSHVMQDFRYRYVEFSLILFSLNFLFLVITLSS